MYITFFISCFISWPASNHQGSQLIIEKAAVDQDYGNYTCKSTFNTVPVEANITVGGKLRMFLQGLTVISSVINFLTHLLVLTRSVFFSYWTSGFFLSCYYKQLTIEWNILSDSKQIDS